ncbi:hypothetical protein F5Y06DRAFT_308120 [Hypoxylon sp. FL0890]|nr:hypothetical protein F5Y06DRAFT_308120 [Hypoxylon sp. FL0890]
MSVSGYQSEGNQHAAGRVTDKLRQQFPSWVAANEVDHNTTSSNSKHSEFLLISNWMFLPGGLQEFYNELTNKVEAIHLSYDLETASLKIKCLISQEEAVVETCQSTIDKIFQGGLDGDSSANKITSVKGWHANEQHQKESVMVFAPQEIQLSTYQTAWIMPEDIIKRGVGASKLVPSEALAELQLLTSCTMMTGNDELVIYIGASSEHDIAVAERKLNTLAKYAGMPSEADTLCESFIYAEDEQEVLATFTFAVCGPKAIPRTFFLDRAKYQLDKEPSAYGKIFGKGVFVTLVRDHPLYPKVVSVDVTPAISAGERNGYYNAFSPAWRYRPKYESGDPGSANEIPSASYGQFEPDQNVAHWITRLPGPEQMLPHGDRTNTPDLDSSTKKGQNQEPIAREQAAKHQSYSHSNRNSQISSKTTWKELQKIGPHPTQENFSEQREQTSQSSRSTFSNQRGEDSRKTRGSGTRDDRYGPQRSQGKGNPGPRGQPRGGRANANSYRGRGRQAGQATPYIQPANLQDQTRRLDIIANSNNDESYPNGYFPPHLRHVHTTAQARAVTESSSDTLKASETNPTELDPNEPGSQKRVEGLRASINEATKQMKALQPQTQGSQPIQSGPLPADAFKSVRNRREASRHTLGQEAPSRPSYIHVKTPDFTPSDEAVNLTPDRVLMQAMGKKLVRMMSSLEVFRGRLTLKAELGRLCLTKINQDYVHIQGSGLRGKAISLQDMKEALDKQHVSPRDVMFTNILTAEGADANYITFMPDSFGKRMWLPDTRRTVYEIACCATINKNTRYRFIVEIDGSDFTYQIRPLQSNSCSLFVHCPKRVWDFQVTFSKTLDLDEIYGGFARDLVDSMRVMPQDSGVPLLEFTVKKAYQVEMLLLRTKNIASYKGQASALPSPSPMGPSAEDHPSTILEICEVHDMTPCSIVSTQDEVTVLFKQYRGSKKFGQLPTWYEVSVQSELVNKAFRQNRNLELGEEVHWSPEQLRDAGAFDDLIRSTTDMVKKIDGVGYWGDNYQDAMIHGVPPSTGSATSSQYSGVRSLKKDPW